ncbi:MAG: tryptophan 2,3-dioxygenase family protein [bacterium]
MKNNYPSLYYGDYLKLDQLLSCQNPKSEEYTDTLAHDEVLFIIVHQAYELWFKQILHELDSVIDIFKHHYINEHNIGIAVTRLARVTEIQKLLIDQLHILETMTPLDFLEFRDFLVPASGFQSYQFRLIENKLGLKAEQRKLFDKSAYTSRLSSEHQKLILESEQDPSLHDLVGNWLERTPFLNLQGFDFWGNYRRAVERVLQRDKQIIETHPLLSAAEKEQELEVFSGTEKNFLALFDLEKHDQLVTKGVRRLSHKATQAALLINLFRDEPILHMPFRFLTTLIEIDEMLTAWRYRHALMVQRMLGTKIGTGGSSGHQYLKATAESHKIFADLTNLSTFLIPRSELPELPETLRKNLGFYYTYSDHAD